MAHSLPTLKQIPSDKIFANVVTTSSVYVIIARSTIEGVVVGCITIYFVIPRSAIDSVGCFDFKQGHRQCRNRGDPSLNISEPNI